MPSLAEADAVTVVGHQIGTKETLRRDAAWVASVNPSFNRGQIIGRMVDVLAEVHSIHPQDRSQLNRALTAVLGRHNFGE